MPYKGDVDVTVMGTLISQRVTKHDVKDVQIQTHHFSNHDYLWSKLPYNIENLTETYEVNHKRDGI